MIDILYNILGGFIASVLSIIAFEVWKWHREKQHQSKNSWTLRERIYSLLSKEDFIKLRKDRENENSRILLFDQVASIIRATYIACEICNWEIDQPFKRDIKLAQSKLMAGHFHTDSSKMGLYYGKESKFTEQLIEILEKIIENFYPQRRR